LAERFVLDATPLSLFCHPNRGLPEVREVREWVRHQVAVGNEVLISEIADYEVRRELLRARRAESIHRLNELRAEHRVLPMTAAVILRAAEFWAQARNAGQPTAPPEALDADAILAAQAEAEGAVVITANAGHVGRFVTAKHWRD
jgi:predicted nucleic acid-binding protein